MFNLSKKKFLVGLDGKIESILFYKGEFVSLNFLISALNEKKKNILEAINILERRLESSAIILMRGEEKFLLTTRKEHSDLISQISGEEKMGELSSSALETLSIILYKDMISKSEIDQIRGINSSYILRNLLIRGLIERKKISEKTCYLGTMDLLRYLGVEHKSKLPDYKNIVEKLNGINIIGEEVFEKK